MIFNISINQMHLTELSKEHEFSFDYRHGAIMEFFKHFFSAGSPKIIDKTIQDAEGNRWWWVKYEIITEALIIFRLKDKKTIKPIIDELENLGFIHKKVMGSGQNKKMYFRQGKNFDTFFFRYQDLNQGGPDYANKIHHPETYEPLPDIAYKTDLTHSLTTPKPGKKFPYPSYRRNNQQPKKEQWGPTSNQNSEQFDTLGQSVEKIIREEALKKFHKINKELKEEEIKKKQETKKRLDEFIKNNE